MSGRVAPMGAGIPTGRQRLAGVFRPLRRMHLPEQVAPDGLPACQTVDLPGRGPVFVRVADGPPDALPVLLLHGWTLNADSNFFGVYGPLARRHPVVAMDARFHARGIPARGRFEVDDCADDAAALLGALGIERAIVCGFSLGGLVATAMALRHPERVAGIVPQASAACYTTRVRDRALWRTVGMMSALARRGYGSRLSSRWLVAAALVNPEFASRWSWVAAELGRSGPVNMIEVGRGVQRWDVRPRLGEIAGRFPAAFVLLTSDRVCVPALQRELAQGLAAHVVAVDADHDLPIVDPAAYADATLRAVTHVAARNAV